MIKLKRIYEKPDENDGIRALVDRLWPRGISKEQANIDFWMKEIAPSTSLRKWYGHDPEKWKEFKEKYKSELEENQEPVKKLKQISKKADITLLFAAKDEEHSHARVIKEYLSKK